MAETAINAGYTLKDLPQRQYFEALHIIHTILLEAPRYIKDNILYYEQT